MRATCTYTDESTEGVVAEFFIVGNITKGRPARIGCDPDRGWAAEPGDVEVLSVTLESYDDDGRSLETQDQINHVVKMFEERIDNDLELKETIEELLCEAAAQDNGEWTQRD